MMVERQVRDMLMSAIDAAQPDPLRHYHVCYWHGEIRCLPSRHTTKSHPVFFTIAGRLLSRGLSPRQVWVLTHRVFHICTMTGLSLDGLSGNNEMVVSNGRELQEELV